MRVNERSVVIVVIAVLVVGVVAGLLLTLGGEEGVDDAGAAPANAAASLAEGPDEVLYLSGTTLVRREVESQEEEPVTDLSTPNVYAAPGSPWLAYVTSEAEDPDFPAEPVLHLYDPVSDEKSTHGAGVAPVWNPAGTHVAFLRPVEPRDCVAEECRGETQIGVVEAATGEETLLLDPGRYTILGWSGEWVLVGDFEDPAKVLTVSLADERAALDMPTSQFWGVSPDGRWVVKTNAKKTEFVRVEDGELGEERVTVDLGQHDLLEGAWAHDSSQVAAVTSVVSKVQKKAKKGGKKKLVRQGATTQVVTFSPDDPAPELVEETYGASGNVLWSPDNESIVFASLLDPRKGLFQARLCPVGNEGECAIVTSWTEGVALLRAQ